MLNLEELLKKTFTEFTSVLAISDQRNDFIAIDLSVNNRDLAQQLHGKSTSEDWEKYIDQFLRTKKKKVAFGGYLEHRFLYERSTYFTQEEQENRRNRHLGIDLWCPAYTGVLAPLDGRVHSFGNNKNHGDYGPTIIIEHQLENITFYTLYGHLSLESIQAIELHQVIKKGEEFAQLGSSSVNGDYAPHLHFQLIKVMEGYLGDYPGVCAVRELDYYIANCPDPNLILKLTL